MKTLVLSMISIAATVAAMTACTSESDPINEINPQDEKVEIKLNAGVINVETKAGPTSGNEDNLFGENIEIQLLRWDAPETSLSTIDWSTAIEKKATATGKNITLDEAHKYYDKEGKNAFFIGFYPALGPNATHSEGTISYNGIDGTVDILSAKLINAGNKKTGATQATDIEFKHMLSQVKIKLAGDKVAKNTFGDITSVTLLNIPQNLDLSLGDGNTAPSIAENETPSLANITLHTSNDAPIVLSEAGTILTTMIVPTFGSTTKNLTIKIETTKFSKENALEVIVEDITDGMDSGTTNNVNLTFKDKVNVTTSIANWEDGKESNKDVDFKE